MSEPLTTEPASLRAGDSVTWTRDLPDYLPAAGWVLKYRLLSLAPPAVTFQATASGSLHLVDLGAAVTATFQAGAATLVAWVEKGAQRATLAQQPITILPDLTTASSLDGRSDNVKALAAAKAALLSATTSGRITTESYEIAGRAMKFRSLKELQDLVAHYERQVARDNALAAAAQGVCAGRVFTRF